MLSKEFIFSYYGDDYSLKGEFYNLGVKESLLSKLGNLSLDYLSNLVVVLDV